MSAKNRNEQVGPDPEIIEPYNCHTCGDRLTVQWADHHCWAYEKIQEQVELPEPKKGDGSTVGSEDMVVQMKYAPQYPDYS